MDVASLYTNIDHSEGAEACFKNLETRQKKSVPSAVIKQLIKLILSNNVFTFGQCIYKQIKGTAMGTPMAPNFANLFMDEFETNLLRDFEEAHGIRPLVWFRYIDDIFFIWTGGEETLKIFIEFAQTYSCKKEMKSDIKFEVHYSQSSVNFLDVTVFMDNGMLKTTLFSKPTDAHMYLNATSCHAKHVISNLPKGQFIRVRRICSEKTDYLSHGAKLIDFFVERGYKRDTLVQMLHDIAKIPRENLLTDDKSVKEDTPVIFVCDYHPVLSRLPIILKKHHHVLQNDSKLNKIFPVPPIVSFRRSKSISGYVVHNAPRNGIHTKSRNFSLKSVPCSKCKLCKHISNDLPTNVSVKASGGTCKSSNVVYAAWCTKHNQIYVGQTGEQLSDRFSKHRYDIKNRPNNSELAGHFHKDHDLDTDLRVTILQQLENDNSLERTYHEDRWICRLQTLAPNGINQDTNGYAKEMYCCFQRSLNSANQKQNNSDSLKFRNNPAGIISKN